MIPSGQEVGAPAIVTEEPQGEPGAPQGPEEIEEQSQGGQE
jgi:hypothetical protein